MPTERVFHESFNAFCVSLAETLGVTSNRQMLDALSFSGKDGGDPRELARQRRGNAGGKLPLPSSEAMRFVNAVDRYLANQATALPAIRGNPSTRNDIERWLVFEGSRCRVDRTQLIRQWDPAVLHEEGMIAFDPVIVDSIIASVSSGTSIDGSRWDAISMALNDAVSSVEGRRAS